MYIHEIINYVRVFMGVSFLLVTSIVGIIYYLYNLKTSIMKQVDNKINYRLAKRYKELEKEIDRIYTILEGSESDEKGNDGDDEREAEREAERDDVSRVDEIQSEIYKPFVVSKVKTV